jgi:hypothetical protein
VLPLLLTSVSSIWVLPIGTGNCRANGGAAPSQAGPTEAEVGELAELDPAAPDALDALLAAARGRPPGGPGRPRGAQAALGGSH